ncbi:MAG TPA: hypothetical protein VN976_22040 [Verrucomicrobiae bacterium]|nr:hypothetical protein [Verrucomicrobiae bacterium]
MKETYPLVWPEGWRRIPLGDRKLRPGWKKTERQTIEALEVELKRFGAIAPVITRRDPGDFRTAPDPSIAVWFSRKREEEDFSWQSVLGIDNPAPTIEEIETAFKRKALPFHPDKGGDIETWHAFDKHKKNAIAYVNQMSGKTRDFCIPCDNFKEARWNINAVRMTVHSLRQMERDGTSGLLERAMKGFTALPEHREASDVVAASS